MRALLYLVLILPLLTTAQQYEPFSIGESGSPKTQDYSITDPWWVIDTMDDGASITIEESGTVFNIANHKGAYFIQSASGGYKEGFADERSLVTITAHPPFMIMRGYRLHIECAPGAFIHGRRMLPK